MEPICYTCYAFHSTGSCEQHIEEFSNKKTYIDTTLLQHYHIIPKTNLMIDRIERINNLFCFILEEYDYLTSSEFNDSQNFMSVIYRKCNELAQKIPDSKNIEEEQIIQRFYTVTGILKERITDTTAVVL